MKNLRKLLNKKGFTLIELLIAVAIFAILMGALGTLVQPMSNLMTDIRKDTRIDTVIGNVGDYIRRSTDSTNKIEVWKRGDLESAGYSVIENFCGDLEAECVFCFFSPPPGGICAHWITRALYLDDDGVLFDLGVVTGLSSAADVTALITDGNKAFFDSYYNNKVLSESFGIIGGGRGLGITMNAIDSVSGENVTSEKTTSFVFVNPGCKASIVSAGDELDNAGGLVILYAGYRV